MMPMRVWIDIDNPPQVQYLAPFVREFTRRGASVLVTARDNGITLGLLHERGIGAQTIGRPFGAGRAAKVTGTLERASRLGRLVRAAGGADLLLAASRSGAIAARTMRVPSFIVIDYEHVELASHRWLGSNLLFPRVIGQEVFERKGFSPRRLIGFHGIKEDLTFSQDSLDASTVPEIEALGNGIRILVRPPAEDSHYFNERSRLVLDEVLDRLAGDPDIQVVFAPRRESQRRWMLHRDFVNEPFVVERPIPFLSLLNSVNWVVCSGGTMLREAAYIGKPAIGILQGPRGKVDAYLESLGAVKLVSNVEELARIDWRTPGARAVVPRNPALLSDLVDQLLVRLQSSSAVASAMDGSPWGG
jgi:predicted glycosyltransferase